MFDNKKKNKKLEKAHTKLSVLYRQIPETEGCMKWLNKTKEEGGCGAWCCKIQNPQVLSVEFFNSWKHVLENWEGDKIADLIEAAMRNYLTSRVTKGCIFHDKEDGTCMQHQQRPYNCRIYGITPEEEFKPRYERLKVLYQDDLNVIIRDQCDKVSTVDKVEVTTKMSDKWWVEACEIEESIGVKKEDIHDREGGTYLTFHDHLLLHVVPNNLMAQLTHMKLHGNDFEKDLAIKGLMKGFRKVFEGDEDGKDNESESS